MIPSTADDLAEVWSLLFSLSGEIRFSVLGLLRNGPLKQVEIIAALKNTANISASLKKPAISANFKNLKGVGLIKETNNQEFSLTPFGRVVLERIDTVHFLVRLKRYFNEHVIDDLPLQFRNRIGELSNSEVIAKTTVVNDKWRKIYQEANDYIKAIKSEVSIDNIDWAHEKVLHGIKYFYILGEDVTIPNPQERDDRLRRLHWLDRTREGRILRRMVKTVKVVMAFNEREASLIFPSVDGEPNLTKAFYSKDPIFHRWCEDYFDHVWNNSIEFSEEKIRKRY
jgi:predicted transcriptional regulator